MPTFLHDTLTHSTPLVEITAGAAEVGGSRIKTNINDGGGLYFPDTASGAVFLIPGAGPTTRGGVRYSYSTAIAASADYTVQVALVGTSTTDDSSLTAIGYMVRRSGSNGYVVGYDYQNELARIWRSDATVLTALGSGYAVSRVVGAYPLIEIRMSGSSLALWVDGTLRETVVDATYGGAGAVDAYVRYDRLTHGNFDANHVRIDAVLGTDDAPAPGGDTATHLAMAQQTAGGAVGASFSPIIIEAQDDDALLDTSAVGTVTAALIAWPAGENEPTLHGTLTKELIGGSATFSDLSANLVGTGYQIAFSHATLDTANSNFFEVTAGDGATTIIAGDDGMQDILKGGSTARRTIEYQALDVTGVPVEGLTGTPSIRVNGGATSTANAGGAATELENGFYAVEVADAAITAGDRVRVTSFSTAYRIVGGYARAVAVDVASEPPDETDVAGAVVAHADFSTTVTTAVEAATITTDVDEAALATALVGHENFSSTVTTAVEAAEVTAVVDEASIGAAVWASPTRALTDKVGFALTSGERSSIGAAVWASTTRSLTTFGSLITDAAAGVWNAATRTLSTYGGVRTELATELARLDVAVSTVATGGVSVEEFAAGVRTELADELANMDAPITSRLASDGYTAPDNAGIAAIQAVTVKLNTALEAAGASYRFTSSALAEAPAGASGGGLTTEQEELLDWIANEVNKAGVRGTRVGDTIIVSEVGRDGLTRERVVTFASAVSNEVLSIGALSEPV